MQPRGGNVGVLRHGKAFWFFATDETVRALGLEKGHALPMFYDFLGREKVSLFAGHGKSISWAVRTTRTQLTQTPTDLSTVPDHIDKDAMHSIEMFVRRSTATVTDEARRELCVKKSNLELIQPTKEARLTNDIYGRTCQWCNGYRRRKRTRRQEFKSWTRLIAFHIALGKGMNPIILPPAMGK